MKEGTFQLSLPYLISDDQAIAFIDQQEAWIQERRRVFESKRIKAGSYVSLFEQKYLVVEDARIFIKKQELHYNGNQEEWKAFLRRFASIRLKERFEKFRMHYGFPAMDLRFGIYRSKWGSCTPAKREIALNLHLAFASEKCIEAIVLHELCHLEHLDHSQAFYQSILVRMPDYYERIEQLKQVQIPIF